MSVTRYAIQSYALEKMVVFEAIMGICPEGEGDFVRATDYDALKTERDTLAAELATNIEKLRRRTELCRKMARILEHDHTQFLGRNIKIVANDTLKELREEMEL